MRDIFEKEMGWKWSEEDGNIYHPTQGNISYLPNAAESYYFAYSQWLESQVEELKECLEVVLTYKTEGAYPSKDSQIKKAKQLIKHHNK